MKASELRIGNKIQCRPKKSYKSYDEHMWHTIEVDAQVVKQINNDAWCFEYRPISLTKDMLIDLGFKFKSKIVVSYRGVKKQSTYSLGKLVFNEDEGFWYYSDRLVGFCQYLHQLQNLYFALTTAHNGRGEELEMKSINTQK
jgi:hypothetical protein